MFLFMATINQFLFALSQNREQPPIIDLTQMSLEELMNIEVTTVAKKTQKLSDSAAAVFVITQEDIRRSGVTSIPEALRMVPGLQVARIDANKWAISSRGFNDYNVSKFLVLIDGRSEFVPTFSGVFWDVQDVILEDIERIEVIRGPGAAYWDSNAVNGVINIILKSAKDTQGGLVSTQVGKEEGIGSFRYGGEWGENVFYRFFAKYSQRDDFTDSEGHDTEDNWDLTHSGFRVDWEQSDSDILTIQGNLYNGEVGSHNLLTLPSPPYYEVNAVENDIQGANILTRWNHTYSNNSNSILQMYYDWAKRDLSILSGQRHIFDFDFKQQINFNDRNEFVYGIDYRFSSDDLEGTPQTYFEPSSRDDHLINLFVHHEYDLIEDQLRFMLGSNFSHNDYTGFEMQPNARLLWTPHERHIFWTSISRTVRVPTRANHDITNILYVSPTEPRNPFPLPITMEVLGDRDIDSEELIASEFGYRFLMTDQLFLDIATFFNIYDNLITGEPGMLLSPSPGQLLLTVTGDNKGDSETYGVETTIDYTPFDWWKLQLAYTFLQMQLHVDNSSGDILFEDAEGDSPHNQYSLRSSFDLAKNVEWDLWFRYVDTLPTMNIPAYLTLDTRLGWTPRENLEVSFGFQNILDKQHPEFGNPTYIQTLPTETEWNIYAKVTWRF